MIHKPVLLNEVLEKLDPKQGEFFVDGTMGAGGHSEKILERIGDGKLLGIDWSESTSRELEKKFHGKENAIVVNDNYGNAKEILKKKKLPKADGLILDLGFSSDQIEGSGKGFSFLRDEILDMRYGDSEMSAAEVINSFNEKDLADIFFKYGEERYSRRIAKEIVLERKKRRILTTADLTEIIRKAVPGKYEKGRIHPATRVFQALRIYVNHELENLEKVLNDLEEIMNSGGRVGIISFHSLEDRIVKNSFREMEKQGKLKIATKKPITPSEEELKDNPRARSAKLRVAIKN